MQRNLLFLIGFIAFALAAFLFFPREFDSELFWRSLGEARPWWIAGSVATTFLGYVVRSMRWQALLLPMGRIGFVPLMNTTVVGFGAIFALGRPGELVRPLWIARQASVSTVGAVASIIVERVFDLLMLLLLFLVGSMWIDLPAPTREALGGLGAPWQLIALVTGAFVAFLLVHRYARTLARLVPFSAFRSLMETFAEGVAGTSTVAGFSIVTLYSMLLWSVHTLQFWFALEGLGLSYPIAASILTLVLSSLGSIAQVPGIGGGFQAGFIVSATALLGAPAEVAVAASLMIWFIITVPTVLVTGAYMIWKGIRVRDLRAPKSGLQEHAQ